MPYRQSVRITWSAPPQYRRDFRPGGGVLRVWKIRHQEWPKRRVHGGNVAHPTVLLGKPIEWSYPAVMEHDGHLYVAYSQGKEDCCLSIIPLTALAVNA